MDEANDKTKTAKDDSVENMEKEITELKMQVLSLEIPFNWNLSQVGPHGDNVITRLEEKDEEIIDPLEFKYRSFILQLIIAYEYFNSAKSLDDANKIKTYLSALQKMKDLENLLYQHKENKCNERIFVVTYEPLLNITMGCKAFIMVNCGMTCEARETLKQLVPIADEIPAQKAAFFGIKASVVMEYGNDKFASALEYAIQARRLDPSVGEWHFLVGNLMARIRRVKQFMSFPQKEEITALETAVEISGYKRYNLHLAQTYREEGFRIFNSFRYNVKENLDKAAEVEKLNQKSLDIYRKLIDENPDDSRLLARCAFGITKLPIPFRDVSLAQETINRALELSPNNPMINHYVAIIYERFIFNPEIAEKYYKIAVDLNVYGATMDLARLKFSQNPKEYDPTPFLKEVAGRFLEKDRYHQTLSQIASYYFFHKNDIPEAWKYIDEITANDPQHASLRTHKSITLRMNDPCDLCEIVLDEVKLKLAHQKYENDSQKETLMKIGVSLRKLCPKSHPYLYCHLRNKILDKSQSLRDGIKRQIKKQKAFYEKGKGRGRGRGRGRGGGPKSSSKQRTNTNQTQWCGFRNRSKSNSKTSQERTFNRSNSKDNVTRGTASNPGQMGWSGNRDRSKSSSRPFSQERVIGNSQSRSQSKNKKKNQSRSSSLEKIPSELKFPGDLADKWQTGSDGINTGLDLQWYGPYFKPRSRNSRLTNVSCFRKSSISPVSRFSERTFSRECPGNRDSSTDQRHQKQGNNDFRTQSLDRIGRSSYSESASSRFDGQNAQNSNSGYKPFGRTEYSSQNYSDSHREPRIRNTSLERDFKPQSFYRENYSNYKPRYSNSCENMSRSLNHYGSFSGSAVRNLSSDRHANRNYNESHRRHDKNSDYNSNKGMYSGSQPASRDSSAESKASLFLPKFGSRTSLQSTSDNEQNVQ